MGKWPNSRIFIKSAIAKKTPELCMMITWMISIVQKNFCCHSNRKRQKIDPCCESGPYISHNYSMTLYKTHDIVYTYNSYRVLM